MKAFLKIVATFVDRFVWTIGFMTIMSYSMDHWPTISWIAMLVALTGFSAWYSWRFAIQPFRTGLKGE